MFVDLLVAAVILGAVVRVVRRPLISGDLNPFGPMSDDADGASIPGDDDVEWDTTSAFSAGDDDTTTFMETDDIHTDPAYSHMSGNIFHHD